MPIDDLWHLTRPPDGAQPCGEHGKLVASGRHGRGKRYRVRYAEPSGLGRERLFDLKKDAENFDVKVRSDVARGEYADPNAWRMPFQDYAEGWRANQVHARGTAAQIETHFRRHVYPFLGGRPVGGIRHSDVQGLVRHLDAALAPATVEVVYRYVVAVFRSAVADGLPASPCVNIRRPKVEKKRVKPLPLHVVEQLRAAMPKRHRALIDLGAMVGLRQGEAFGLEVGHVDFLRRTVRIEQQVLYHVGGKPYLGPPKTPSSRRTIPVGREFIDRLAAHLAEFPPTPVPIVDRDGTRTVKLVCTTTEGKPWPRPRYSERVWRPAVADVGLEDEPTFHDLRHFFASALIAAGASVTQVQHRLGHATAAETLNTYSHLWPDEDDRTRDIIDRLFRTCAHDVPGSCAECSAAGQTG